MAFLAPSSSHLLFPCFSLPVFCSFPAFLIFRYKYVVYIVIFRNFTHFFMTSVNSQ